MYFVSPREARTIRMLNGEIITSLYVIPMIFRV